MCFVTDVTDQVTKITVDGRRRIRWEILGSQKTSNFLTTYVGLYNTNKKLLVEEKTANQFEASRKLRMHINTKKTKLLTIGDKALEWQSGKFQQLRSIVSSKNEDAEVEIDRRINMAQRAATLISKLEKNSILK